VVKGQGKEGNEEEEGEEDESCESGAGDEPTPSSELEGPGAQTDAGAPLIDRRFLFTVSNARTRTTAHAHTKQWRWPTDCDQEDDSIWVIGKENTVSLIPLDLPRTFPCLSFFQVGGPSHGPLGQVLEAYVCYRPDIGYVQGMSYLAAVMLLYMDTFPAFCCLANLLNSPILVHVLLSLRAITEF